MILKPEEINTKKKEDLLYTECYSVFFWQKDDDGFWQKKEQVYLAKEKSKNTEVFNKWKSEYDKLEVKFISLKYH